MLSVIVPQSDLSVIAEFYAVPGNVATLLNWKTCSRVLKAKVHAKNCEMVLESAKPFDKKAILMSKFPRVFDDLAKLKVTSSN